VSETGPAPYGLIVLIGLVILLGQAGRGTARTFWNVCLDSGMGGATAQIGVLAAVAQLPSVPAAVVTPLLSERWGKVRTYALTSLGVALILPLALIGDVGAAGLGFVCMGALMSIPGPAFTVHHQEVVSPGSRAAMPGKTNMAAGLGWAVMAMVGGYMITAVGYRSLFVVGAALVFTGALLS
jgi:predicted MFS family arabinose efflux permease